MDGLWRNLTSVSAPRQPVFTAPSPRPVCPRARLYAYVHLYRGSSTRRSTALLFKHSKSWVCRGLCQSKLCPAKEIIGAGSTFISLDFKTDAQEFDRVGSRCKAQHPHPTILPPPIEKNDLSQEPASVTPVRGAWCSDLGLFSKLLSKIGHWRAGANQLRY